MTLLAGVFSRRPDRPIADEVSATLGAALSRHSEDAVQTFRDARCFLAKVDVGAYGAPAFLNDGPGATVSILSGEPLLTTGSHAAARTRDSDLALLHREWRRGNWDALTAAQGVFNAAHYQAAAGSLTLTTDKLGLRPLYYWIGQDYCVFASALRILESLALVPKVLDVRAVTELALFGFSLSDRTPYADVRVLKAAEIVQVSATQIERRHYWRWDRIAPSQRRLPDLLGEAYERFTSAVRRRLRGDAVATAFLSGGLDSRCVVTALRSEGADLHTVNFGLPGSQDRVFGAAYAQAIGSRHEEVPMPAGRELKWSTMMRDALAISPQHAARPPERPRLAWSGDVGSVGVGHIYISREIVALLRAEGPAAAAGQFLREWKATMSRRLVQPHLRETVHAVPEVGICEELALLDCADPGRAFHVFLLLNSQRRHLAGHFEEIDLHRLELQLPFTDSAFLESILAAPMDLCLRHGLYAQWLSCFPSVLQSVPWQTYPGHVPCALTLPGAGYQWDPAQFADFHAERKRALLQRAAEIVRADDFPDALLRRWVLRVASGMWRWGVRDYSHVVNSAATFHRYWSHTGGRYALPPALSSAARAAATTAQ